MISIHKGIPRSSRGMTVHRNSSLGNPASRVPRTVFQKPRRLRFLIKKSPRSLRPEGIVYGKRLFTMPSYARTTSRASDTSRTAPFHRMPCHLQHVAKRDKSPNDENSDNQDIGEHRHLFLLLAGNGINRADSAERLALVRIRAEQLEENRRDKHAGNRRPRRKSGTCDHATDLINDERHDP